MALRDLAERSADGVVVRLVWNDAPESGDVFVEYHDEREGVSYILRPPRDRVLDAFYHPNAYAANAQSCRVRLLSKIHD